MQVANGMTIWQGHYGNKLLSFTSTEVKILDFDRVLFGYYYYYYYYFLFTFSVAPPYLKN